DMPLNSIPPTTTPDALAGKRAAAKEQVLVDVGFWGGAVPGNRSELAALHDAGVFGFKCFLTDSGVPEFPALDPVEFEAAARRAGARVHILHLSSAECLPLIEEAKAGGVRVTVETCPHYLFFAAEDVPDGATEYKCCPPIRPAANRERLWAALDSGLIDFI